MGTTCSPWQDVSVARPDPLGWRGRRRRARRPRHHRSRRWVRRCSLRLRPCRASSTACCCGGSVAGARRRTRGAGRGVRQARKARPPEAAGHGAAAGCAFACRLPSRRSGADNDMVRYMPTGGCSAWATTRSSSSPLTPAFGVDAYRDHAQDAEHPRARRRTPRPRSSSSAPSSRFSETPRAMKLALVAVRSAATIWVLVTWLRQTNRSPWLALRCTRGIRSSILEVAHSGHIDALGALWIAVAAWMLHDGADDAGGDRVRDRDREQAARRSCSCRSSGSGSGSATRWRARPCSFLLYLPFRSAGALPLGAVPNVVAFIRFNGPLFKGLAALLTPQGSGGGGGARRPRRRRVDAVHTAGGRSGARGRGRWRCRWRRRRSSTRGACSTSRRFCFTHANAAARRRGPHAALPVYISCGTVEVRAPAWFVPSASAVARVRRRRQLVRGGARWRWRGDIGCQPDLQVRRLVGRTFRSGNASLLQFTRDARRRSVSVADRRSM